MGVHDLKFGAGEFAALVGSDTVQIRDWRRRGILNTVGAEVGGKWLYSIRDVCVLKISELFRDNGMDLKKSVWLSYAIMAFLLEYTKGEGSLRFVLLTDFHRDDLRRLLTASSMSELESNAEHYGIRPVGDIVDLEAVSLALPEYLNEIVAAANN